MNDVSLADSSAFYKVLTHARDWSIDSASKKEFSTIHECAARTFVYEIYEYFVYRGPEECIRGDRLTFGYEHQYENGIDIAYWQESKQEI